MISKITSNFSFGKLERKIEGIQKHNLNKQKTKIVDIAKKNIAKLKIENVQFKLGNGYEGWGDKFLFDAIIIGAASEVVPVKLLESLKPNGRLIMPKKYDAGNQKLLLVTKKKWKF